MTPPVNVDIFFSQENIINHVIQGLGGKLGMTGTETSLTCNGGD